MKVAGKDVYIQCAIKTSDQFERITGIAKITAS